MNSEERKKAVKVYKDLLKEKEHYEALEKERQELLKDPNVQRYLELEDRKDHEPGFDYYLKKTEDELAIWCYRSINPEVKSDIYIYVGAYKNDPYDCDIVHGSAPIPVDPEEERPEWYYLKSVDHYGEDIYVSPFEFDKFKEENLILYPEPGKAYAVEERYALLVMKEGLVKARKKITAEYGKK